MANPFRWLSGSKSTSNEKDLFSESFYAGKPAATITEQNALKIPAVKSAVSLISDSIAQLPIYLYQEELDGSISKVADDSRINLLNAEANQYCTGQMLKKSIVKDYLLYGHAYLLNRYDKLFYLQADKMEEVPYTEDYITVAAKKFKYNGQRSVELDESEVIVIDSCTNGLLIDSGELFNTALGQLEYQNNLIENNAVPTGVLQVSSRLTENAINRLRESWNSLYKGNKNAGKTVILEEGMEFKPLAMEPDKLGLNESQKRIISEICRVFNLPESMINSAANKYGSLEQNSIQFLQNCIGPILISIESSLGKHLLTQPEKDLGFYFRFDTSELIRTTEKEKIEAISTALDKGLISFNQAMNKLDLPPVEKDYHKLNIGDVLLYADGSLENLNILQKNTQQSE